jgi:hypothetical protein
MSNYFFIGTLIPFTNSTRHAGSHVACRTELSFVRQIRKILKDYEPDAQIQCVPDWHTYTPKFVVDRTLNCDEVHERKYSQYGLCYIGQ